MAEFLVGVTDISFSIYPSSWGRLQCNAQTYDGKQYQAWAGRPEQDLTMQMLIDAIELIDKQIPKEKEEVDG